MKGTNLFVTNVLFQSFPRSNQQHLFIDGHWGNDHTILNYLQIISVKIQVDVFFLEKKLLKSDFYSINETQVWYTGSRTGLVGLEFQVG